MVDKLRELRLAERLPVVGIVSFSLCSVWSLYHLFVGNAIHPTPLYWLAAGLVELLTAWVVYQIVEQVRQLTKSNLSKQDRRFYGIITIAFVLIAIPTLATSVWANTIEFSNMLLGLLFPVSSIGCAIGASLPQAVARFAQQRASERQARESERKQRARERKEAATKAQAEATNAQEVGNLMATLGNAGATLEQYRANPAQSQASVAQALSISRQAVGNHLRKLEEKGLISRENGGVCVLV